MKKNQSLRYLERPQGPLKGGPVNPWSGSEQDPLAMLVLLTEDFIQILMSDQF